MDVIASLPAILLVALIASASSGRWINAVSGMAIGAFGLKLFTTRLQ
jgi:hypothetical protein